MPGNPRHLVAEAERRFPVRVRVAVPPGGFGARLERMRAWLDETCGADGWKMTPAGMRGVVNDAVALYFQDATLAAAFVARWCVASAGAADGFLRMREDEPAKHPMMGLHGTPPERCD